MAVQVVLKAISRFCRTLQRLEDAGHLELDADAAADALRTAAAR